MDYKYEGKTTENEHGIVVEGRLIPQPTDKELLLMANFLKAACLRREKCIGCVFHRNSVCDLRDEPLDWTIKESDWLESKLRQEKCELDSDLRERSMNWVLRGREEWKT